MKLLVDTNVVLDVLLKREPFYENGAKVLKLSGREDVEEYVSASAITDIYYIAYRTMKDRVSVRKLLENLLKIVSVVAVSGEEINYALELEWEDFEDSVQYAVAQLNDMDGLVTRNVDDYKKSEITIYTPEQLLEQFKRE